MPLPTVAADSVLVPLHVGFRNYADTLELAILATPTGARRNALCDANIHLNEARRRLRDALMTKETRL